MNPLGCSSPVLAPRLTVTVPPEPVVTLEEAKLHLRVDAGDDDTLISALIDAATQHIDGPMGWLGRALGVQTIEARAAFFDASKWTLPCPPVIGVTSIEYVDSSGVVRLLDETSYEVRGHAIVRAFGKSWPSVRRDDESVRVTYTAGYETMPAPIRAAILLMVGDLYAFRETAIDDGRPGVIPMATPVANLLAPYRLWV